VTFLEGDEVYLLRSFPSSSPSRRYRGTREKIKYCYILSQFERRVKPRQPPERGKAERRVKRGFTLFAFIAIRVGEEII